MVAMVAVRMMQVTGDQIIGVIAVRHGGMAAVGGVNVTSRLLARSMTRSALVGIRGADGDDMIVNMPGVLMMQMARVEIVRMMVVGNRGMAAIGAVNVRVRSGMLLVARARSADERERQGENSDFFHGRSALVGSCSFRFLTGTKPSMPGRAARNKRGICK